MGNYGNMYFTLYHCLKNKFKYQNLIANIGYQNSIVQDKADYKSTGFTAPRKVKTHEIDAISDIVTMLICQN